MVLWIEGLQISFSGGIGLFYVYKSYLCLMSKSHASIFDDAVGDRGESPPSDLGERSFFGRCRVATKIFEIFLGWELSVHATMIGLVVTALHFKCAFFSPEKGHSPVTYNPTPIFVNVTWCEKL